MKYAVAAILLFPTIAFAQSVDLKVNGNESVTVKQGQSLNFTWKASGNVQGCGFEGALANDIYTSLNKIRYVDLLPASGNVSVKAQNIQTGTQVVVGCVIPNPGSSFPFVTDMALVSVVESSSTVSIGTSTSSAFKLTSPSKNVVWKRGKTVHLKWKSNKKEHSQVSVQAIGKETYVIAETTNRNGVKWKLTRDIVPGTYQISINGEVFPNKIQIR